MKEEVLSKIARDFKSYSEWLSIVPTAHREDTLWSMEVYRQSLFAADLAWYDILAFKGQYGTRDLADQLYRASCSVSANIAEGYSRSSGKDRRRFYEYALGSARECRDWYFKVRHVLEEPVSTHRTHLQTALIRQLLVLIPKQTTFVIRETQASYVVDSNTTSAWPDIYGEIPFSPESHYPE